MVDCKLCGEETATSPQSHIIPRSFYKLVQQRAKFMVEGRVVEGKLRKVYPQAGIWDRFLCGVCERRFDVHDNFGYKVLGKHLFSYLPIYNPALDLNGFVARGVDSGKLKLFLLSMIWRASACSAHFFQHVDLGGEAERRIRDLIWNSCVPEQDEFTYSIKLITGGPRALYQPYSHEWNGVRFVQFYLPRLAIQMKVDSQASPLLWRPVEITNGEVVGYVFPYEGSEMEEWTKQLALKSA